MEKESRRVQMTKRLMNDAMLEALKEKPPEKLTVAEICRSADINRSTYYKYYADPLQQYEMAKQQTIDGIAELIENYEIKKLFTKKEIRRFVMVILDYVEEHIEMVRILDKYSGVEFWYGLSMKIGKTFMNKANDKREPPEDLMEMGAFVFTGSYALIFRWVNMGQPKDKTALADSIIMYVSACLKAKFKVLPR